MTTTPGPAVAPPLSYATPMPSARPRIPWLLVIMTALAIGYLVSDVYGLTAGFAADAEALVTVRIIGGILAIGWVIGAAGPVSRLARAIVNSFSARQTRPSCGICLTLILCGTACMFGCLAVELSLARSGEMMISATSPDAFGRGFGHVAIGMQSPLFGHLAAGLTFLAGSVLCAIGIWGSVASEKAIASADATGATPIV